MLFDWFKNIHFAYPYLVGLSAAIPMMIWWYVYKTDRQRATMIVSGTGPFGVATWKNWFRHVPFVLRVLAVICLIAALARPQRFNDEELHKGEGIDIVLCMDVSGSMLSTDFQPNRLEAAKAVAAEFVRSRPVDRIGLVIFSGESYTQCPITTDRNTLLTMIYGLQSGMLKDGTLIGEGLATSVSRLAQSDAKSKVVILLTDGKEEPPETRLIDPLTALEIAKAQGVKVYTIGMAVEGFVAVGEKNATGGGKEMKVYLDEDLLRKIATETGGLYFRARDRNSLDEIYARIDQMEKTKIEVQALRRYEEEFFPFVLAALVLLFAELVLRFTLLRRFP